ncbi:MAG: helix-turn-helix transcriptional regulator [Clostridia bacterium]|nr:helix-turn-helix transcriptional regulator [Clostridia bacterium]
MAIDNRIVAANISKLRNHRGMTQFQLAAALNVSHQAVSKWETGAALPDIQTLLALTQLFGVTMEELLNTEIVVRDEDADEEAKKEASEQTIFPGFFSGLIPEEAKQALKNAAGEARKTFIEVSENLSAHAEKTFSKAAEFAEKAKSDIESRFKAKDDEAAKNEPEPKEEKTEETPKASNTTVSFEKLSRMAPFMSREKLCELVMRYAESADLESIVQIAPFLNRAAVQKLLEKCIDQKADSQILRRLAPFAGADQLYTLILANLDAIDWKTLEGLAPFLKRHMVDALAEYAITGVKPSASNKNYEPESAKESIKDALEGVMGEIGNVVNEIGSVARSIFSPKKEEAKKTEDVCAEPEEAEMPAEPEISHMPQAPTPPSMEETEKYIPAMEETEQFIPSMEEIEKFTPAPEEIKIAAPAAEAAARYALEKGNWSWIKDHAHEIKDDAHLCEIAVSAVAAVAQSDSAAIVMKIIHRLTEEGKRRVFEKVAEENAWELAVALQTYASEENAGIIVQKAAEAEGASREEAYLAIECYAKITPKDILDEITEKAVKDDNWVLLSALADAY